MTIEFDFWPSIAEIEESSLSDSYVGGLGEFFDSVKGLERVMNSGHIFTRKEVKTHYGFFPEPILSITVIIGSTGIATALYNLLKTWVDAKNGRKLRVKIGTLEVEATQMTEKQFLGFIEKLKEYQEAAFETETEEFQSRLSSEGLTVRRRNSMEYISESNAVTLAAQRSILVAREKPSINNLGNNSTKKTSKESHKSKKR